MSDPAEAAGPTQGQSTLFRIARFSLLAEKADDDQIDAGLRGGADLKGSTSWILMLAILIASIGLNTDSTAVIIGAMLISPLMGPIMGIGYGVGIYDFELVKRSFVNLGTAMAISLATSTLYFALTPLAGTQSELLARTSPTIWDVQIALFGGLAGIIGATRREKSIVIPGVAIATALMPPLCTAGFGLASGNWQYFFGAFYLFTINSVFIAAAAVIVVRLLGLPVREYVNARVERRVKGWVLAVTLLTALPSVYLAAKLVSAEVFNARARALVEREFRLPGTYVLAQSASAEDKRITVTLIGEVVQRTTLQDIRARLSEFGLPGAVLEVYQTREAAAEVMARQEGTEKGSQLAASVTLSEQEKTIAELREELGRRAPWLADAPDIARELHAQWPGLTDIVVGAGRPALGEEAGAGSDEVALLGAVSSAAVSAKDIKRMRAWFKVRTKAASVHVMIERAAPSGRR